MSAPIQASTPPNTNYSDEEVQATIDEYFMEAERMAQANTRLADVLEARGHDVRRMRRAISQATETIEEARSWSWRGAIAGGCVGLAGGAVIGGYVGGPLGAFAGGIIGMITAGIIGGLFAREFQRLWDRLYELELSARGLIARFNRQHLA